MDLRLGVLGVAIAIGSTSVVAVRAGTAPQPKADRRATPPELTQMAAQITAGEPEWRAKSAESFPSDDWSQRDDFHAREGQRIRELAKAKGIPYEDVLRAVDDDLHKGQDAGARGTRAVPCKPRPFYD